MKQLLRSLADNRQGNSWANFFRRKRMAHFDAFTRDLHKPLQILDIGGTQEFWEQVGWADPSLVQVTLVNLSRPLVTRTNFQAIEGDARALPEIPRHSFDVVFSNSVIEHVGSYDDQQRMANEVRRIGKRYFIQTPARSFPLEPHFLFPFFALLPRSLQAWLITRFALGWYPRQRSLEEAHQTLKNFRLLNYRELSSLFPGATILRERVLGVTKSYLAMRRVCY